MLELVLILAFLAAAAWIAVRAFQNPEGCLSGEPDWTFAGRRCGLRHLVARISPDCQ
jgi:hypothetical protein